MGQYYKTVNVDNGQWTNSHNFGGGVKLMEHSYVNNEYVNFVKTLLMPNGPWYKNRIVWAGDYGDLTWEQFSKDSVTKFANALGNTGAKLYDCGNEPELAPPRDSDPHVNEMFLVNHDKKEYISYHRYIKKWNVANNSDDWVIDPLPILTADGNGRGGGDYDGTNMNRVGTWAGDRISLEEKEPTGEEFVELTMTFKEER